MVEQEISVLSAGHTLVGTLCLPDGERQQRFPTVLMVHGSGPLDRNENFRGQTLNAFNSIAHFLASRGIASVRYDKRGCGASTGDFVATGHFDLVDDAASWLQLLESQPECDPASLFVLGHSEGTVIAPQLFLRHPTLAGLVLLCPFVENLESVLMRQASVVERELAARPGLKGALPNLLARSLGANVRSQKRFIDRIRRSTTDSIRIRLQKVPARWFRELFALDIPAIYRQVHCSVLMLGGEKDLQCDPNDVAKIEALIPGPVTAELVPNLTHLLRLEPGEPSLVGARRLLTQPLEPVVIEAVSIWVQEQVAAER